MANSQEIFEQITELYSQFEAEHNGTTKAELNQQHGSRQLRSPQLALM